MSSTNCAVLIVKFEMKFIQVSFDRLFSIQRVYSPLGEDKYQTHFGFESNGKRYFDVITPGWPKIEQGMSVVVLLRQPSTWDRTSLLGWIDCSDGTITCYSPYLHLGMFLLLAFFLSLFAISSVQSSWMVDLVIIVVFGFGSIWPLYKFGEGFLINLALKSVSQAVSSRNRNE